MNEKEKSEHSPADWIRGWKAERDYYVCLFCGESYFRNGVFEDGDALVNAEGRICSHIKEAHLSVFEALVALGANRTGLSEVQAAVLAAGFRGIDDKNTAADLGISPSTVRNHRFRLKEKQRQARIFLAIMDLLDAGMPAEQQFVAVPSQLKMVDERFSITEAEMKEILIKYTTAEGRFARLPRKEKHKIVLLLSFRDKLDRERKYTEAEINAEIMKCIDDYVTFRRYLIQYGMMDRTRDGSSYWALG